MKKTRSSSLIARLKLGLAGGLALCLLPARAHPTVEPTDTLPESPADYRTGTVAVQGCMPTRGACRTVHFYVHRPFQGFSTEELTVKTDTAGRFSAALPATGPVTAYFRCDPFFLRLLLSPGDTLRLRAGADNEVHFEGGNARLNREVNHVLREADTETYPDTEAGDTLASDEWFRQNRAVNRRNREALEACFRRTPGLSARARTYLTTDQTCHTLFNLLQSNTAFWRRGSASAPPTCAGWILCFTASGRPIPCTRSWSRACATM